MTLDVNDKAYANLVREDIEWLRKVVPTKVGPEKDHILAILDKELLVTIAPLREGVVPIPGGQLMAFYKYNIYPYCCCGIVTAMNERGYVELKEIGPNRFFKAFMIVPKTVGLKLKGEIEALKNLYQNDIDNLKKDFNRRLKKVIDVPYLRDKEI